MVQKYLITTKRFYFFLIILIFLLLYLVILNSISNIVKKYKNTDVLMVFQISNKSILKRCRIIATLNRTNLSEDEHLIILITSPGIFNILFRKLKNNVKNVKA